MIAYTIAVLAQIVSVDHPAERLTPQNTPKAVTCWLTNGDNISGTLVSINKTNVRIKHGTLGRLTVKRSGISICESQDSTVRRMLSPLVAPLPPSVVALSPVSPAASILELQRAPMSPVQPRAIPKEAIARRPVVIPLAAAIATSASTVGWKRSLSVSYTVTQGNSNASDLGFSGTATRRAERSQVAVKARRILGKRNGQSATDFFSTNLRYDRALGPNDAAAANRPSFFSEATFESDPFAKLQGRVVSNTGLSIPLSLEPTNNLALEVGVGVTNEKLRYTSNKTKASGVVRLAARQKFGITNSDQQIATYPDYSGEAVKYRINTDLNFTAPISAKLSLRLGLINRYNTRPQTNVKKSDTTIQSGIGIEF